MRSDSSKIEHDCFVLAAADAAVVSSSQVLVSETKPHPLPFAGKTTETPIAMVRWLADMVRGTRSSSFDVVLVNFSM
jgi:hypothetical protein